MTVLVQDTPMNLNVPLGHKFLLALCFFPLFMSNLVYGQSTQKILTGKVLYTNGLVTLVGKKTPLRIIGKEQLIYSGDRIATGLNSKAIIKLLDGTQISLVEKSEFLISQFSIEKKKEQLELQLFRGGIRAVSGFINKFSSNKVSLLTPKGQVAVRGTDFTAFICAKSCVDEGGKQGRSFKSIESLVKGRLIFKQGNIKARASNGQIRNLFDTSPLYSGDIISSEQEATMVAVFRDDTRVTLNPDSVFQVGNYQYRPDQDGENYAAFKLLRGSIRFLSGDIARFEQANYLLSVPGYNLSLIDAGIDLGVSDFSHISIWHGKVNFTFADQSLAMLQGNSFLIPGNADKPLEVREFPGNYNLGPKPNSQKFNDSIKTKKLFATQVVENKTGLFLYVKSGEIEAQKGSLALNLGSEEAGYVGDNSVYRMEQLPDFLIEQFLDPRVDQKMLERLNLLPDLNIADPQGPICEI